MTTLEFIIWGAVQLITMVGTVAVVAWKISQFAYKRQVETLKVQIDFLNTQIGRVDWLEAYFKAQNEAIKAQYEQALKEKDVEKSKDLRILEDQNLFLQKQIADLKNEINSYQQNVDKISKTNYATGRSVKFFEKFPDIYKSLVGPNLLDILGWCSKCGKLESKKELLGLGGVCKDCYLKIHTGGKDLP